MEEIFSECILLSINLRNLVRSRAIFAWEWPTVSIKWWTERPCMANFFVSPHFTKAQSALTVANHFSCWPLPDICLCLCRGARIDIHFCSSSSFGEFVPSSFYLSCVGSMFPLVLFDLEGLNLQESWIFCLADLPWENSHRSRSLYRPCFMVLHRRATWEIPWSLLVFQWLAHVVQGSDGVLHPFSW